MAWYSTCITTNTVPDHLSISRLFANKTWTPPERATHHFPAENQGLRFWGADLYLSRLTLSFPVHAEGHRPRSPTEHIFWISDQKKCIKNMCLISSFILRYEVWHRIEVWLNIYPAFRRMGKRFLKPSDWTYVNWFIIFCRCGCMCAARVKIYAELCNSWSNIIKWGPYLGGVFHGGKEPRTHAFSLLSCALR